MCGNNVARSVCVLTQELISTDLESDMVLKFHIPLKVWAENVCLIKYLNFSSSFTQTTSSPGKGLWNECFSAGLNISKLPLGSTDVWGTQLAGGVIN